MDPSEREGAAFSIFDYLSDPVIVTDARFEEPGPRVVYVNDAFAGAWGRSPELLLGRPLSAVHPGLRRDEQLDAIGRCCRARRTYRNRSPLETADGGTISMSWHIAPVFRDGKLRHLMCFLSEAAESPAAIGSLRAREKRYRQLFELGLVGKAVVTADGCFSEVNESFCDLTGYDREELIGEHTSVILRPEDRATVYELLRQVINRERTGYQTERQYVHKAGHTVTFLVDVMPEESDDGEIHSVVIQAQDITELKKTETGLRDSERRLRDFAEIAADWFWETDENLVITYISDVHRVITGIPDEQIIGRTRAELFRDGVYKAENPTVHLRTLNHYWESMVEYSVLREDGREVIIHDRASPFFDAEGNFKGYRGVGRDITEQKRLTARIAHQATRDPLTGIFNRREFERRVDLAIKEVRIQDSRHVLCFADLNKFKLLNDTLGHAAGDETLRIVVEKIQDHIRPGDLIGRLGGDEFGLLMKNIDVDEAKRVAEGINQSIEAHDSKFDLALSIGIARINGSERSTSELMARVDSACYRAKAEGNGIWISDENEAARLRTYTHILGSLTGGPVDLSDYVQLVGQPICALSGLDERPRWYEVLLRVKGGNGHLYRPHEFIRLAEQHGKMPMVDHWVMEQAVALHAGLVEAVPDAILSVNIADNSLTGESLRALTSGVLADSPVKPANLCFEIGEATAMMDLKQTIALTESLAADGFLVALDEFGRGPSSFECLKSLPLHGLKLYGNLVRELCDPGPDLAIVESMRDLSRRLGLTMVAVQVETMEAARALTHIGVDYGQGDALFATRPLGELVRDLKG